MKSHAAIPSSHHRHPGCQAVRLPGTPPLLIFLFRKDRAVHRLDLVAAAAEWWSVWDLGMVRVL